MLLKLTEMGFLNYFEVLWSKVGVFVYGRSLSLSVNIRKNLVDSWKSLLVSGDLVIFVALRG